MAVFVMQFPIACFVVWRLENIYAHKKKKKNEKQHPASYADPRNDPASGAAATNNILRTPSNLVDRRP